MTIQSELMALKDSDGVITPHNVVAWAKAHPRSELHGKIQWDDKKAADEHRLWQVRQLIAVHLVYEDGERRTVNLKIDRANGGGGYRDLEDIKGTDLMEHALSDALEDLQRVRARYHYLRELNPIWEKAEEVRAKRKTSRSAARPREARQAERSNAQQS